MFDPVVTTRLGQGGSGLGVHIARHIVHQIPGGGIELRGEAGRGHDRAVFPPQPDRPPRQRVK